MYRLAIIDDEPLIQRGLHSLVHYRELSLLPCDFVNTGRDALSLIRTQRPDIVLLDIAMPDMSGIDVMQHVREAAGYTPVFLILTNHQDFSYAQTALRLGAADFITKIEVNESVLNEALQRVIRQIQEKNPVGGEAAALSANVAADKNAQNSFFDKLLDHYYADREEAQLKQELEKCGIHGPWYGVACLTLSGLLPEENNTRITAAAAALVEDCLKRSVSCHVSLWEADSIVCVLGLPEDPSHSLLLQKALASASRMIHRYINKLIQIGVGILSGDPRRIPASFTQSRILCRKALPGQEAIFAAEDEIPEEEGEKQAGEFHLCEYRNELAEAFSASDSSRISQCLDRITDQHIRPGNTLCNALSICFSLFHFISTMLPDTGSFAPGLFGEYRDPVESIRNIRSQQEAADWIRQLRDALCDYLDENLLRNGNWLVSDICDYISRHSGDPLSLQEVAEAFDRSPTYISSLFRKHRDIGFAEYVRNARLARAKELLAQGHKIREVAEALGYSDPYYFNKVFRKAENMSPSDYVHSLQGRQSGRMESQERTIDT